MKAIDVLIHLIHENWVVEIVNVKEFRWSGWGQIVFILKLAQQIKQGEKSSP